MKGKWMISWQTFRLLKDSFSSLSWKSVASGWGVTFYFQACYWFWYEENNLVLLLKVSLRKKERKEEWKKETNKQTKQQQNPQKNLNKQTNKKISFYFLIVFSSNSPFFIATEIELVDEGHLLLKGTTIFMKHGTLIENTSKLKIKFKSL